MKKENYTLIDALLETLNDMVDIFTVFMIAIFFAHYFIDFKRNVEISY